MDVFFAFFYSKRRGIILTLVLLWEFATAIRYIFEPITFTQGEMIIVNSRNLGWLVSQAPAIRTVSSLIMILILWEIWFWKKWAINLYYVLSGIKFLLAFVLIFLIYNLAIESLLAAVSVFLILLLDCGLIYWATKRKEKNFT